MPFPWSGAIAVCHTLCFAIYLHSDSSYVLHTTIFIIDFIPLRLRHSYSSIQSILCLRWCSPALPKPALWFRSDTIPTLINMQRPEPALCNLALTCFTGCPILWRSRASFETSFRFHGSLRYSKIFL